MCHKQTITYSTSTMTFMFLYNIHPPSKIYALNRNINYRIFATITMRVTQMSDINFKTIQPSTVKPFRYDHCFILYRY